MTPTLMLGPIVGGLSDTTANLWGRADGAGRLHAWLGRKADLSDAVLAGKSLPLRPEDGYAGVAPVKNLQPGSDYYYAITFKNHPPAKPDGRFTTFPRPGKPLDFSFAFGSCFCPAEANGLIFKSLEAHRLAADKTAAERLRFILLIGDQIYSDVWDYNNLGHIAFDLDDYRAVYQHVWSNEHFQNLLCNLPAFMTLDDHEVDDDWRWADSNRQRATFSSWARFVRWYKGRPSAERHLTAQRVLDALQAYWEHQGMHAPSMTLPPDVDEAGHYVFERHAPGSLAYSFTYGAAAFFVMDTRTMRVRNSGEVRMLGDGQWHALKEWLLKAKDKYPVKFLVTSSSVLYSMWGDFLGDRWSGFRAERDVLLRFIGENNIQNVYLIAGDLHSAHSMQAECGPRDAPVQIHEFCSTPFEQDCNHFARWLYIPILTGAVHKPRRRFIVTEPNYGLVHVRFGGDAPQVDFELYGTDGTLLEPKKR